MSANTSDENHTHHSEWPDSQPMNGHGPNPAYLLQPGTWINAIEQIAEWDDDWESVASISVPYQVWRALADRGHITWSPFLDGNPYEYLGTPIEAECDGLDDDELLVVRREQGAPDTRVRLTDPNWRPEIRTAYLAFRGDCLSITDAIDAAQLTE